MKRTGIILLGATLLVAQPLMGQKLVDPAFADGSTVTYTFSGTENGRYGPYIGTFSYLGNNPVNIYCVDLYRAIAPGYVITASVSNLNTGTFTTGPLGYGGTNLQTDLKKAAWLSTQFWSQPTTEWQAIHEAIWSFTSGRAVTGTAATWAQTATDNFAGYGNYSDWSLLRFESGYPVNDPNISLRQTQDMLVQSSSIAASTSVAPEPQTYILMVTGLIFLVFVGRRRLKENGYI